MGDAAIRISMEKEDRSAAQGADSIGKECIGEREGICHRQVSFYRRSDADVDGQYPPRYNVDNNMTMPT